MKTKEDLNALKAEVETLSKKLAELTEEELREVTGGISTTRCPKCGSIMHLDPSTGEENCMNPLCPNFKR